MFTSFVTCITGYNNFRAVAQSYMTKHNILRTLLVKDRRCTLNNFYCATAADYSYVKCSRASIANILHNDLKMQKVSAHWVPRQFLKTHLDQRRTAALIFLTNLLLNQIVTGDESWVQYWTPESKLASTQWKGKRNRRR